jgi:ABC-type transport system involved in multi-copper enzyme maturation permease subunit
MMFYSLAVVLTAFCLLAGTHQTADCLSEEKREGTLGLLFLTDLKGYDVVFGKVAATSLNLFYIVLALFPVLAIPLLVGGVSFSEVGRIALVLLNTLWLSLALGLWVSARSWEQPKAVWTAFVLICLVTTMPLLLDLVLTWGNYDVNPWWRLRAFWRAPFTSPQR